MGSRRAEPGEMDRQIALKVKVTTQDAEGGEGPITYSLLTNGNVFAAQRTVDAEEQMKTGQLTTKETCTFIVYYRSDLENEEEDHVVEYRGQVWDIKGIELIGYNDQLALKCEVFG